MISVDFDRLCSAYGVCTVAYCNAGQMIQQHPIKELAERTSGFCCYINDQPTIFFDDSRPAIDVRFTIAHELGHILLGHLSFRHELLERLPDSAEREADAFAVQLLANDLAHRYEAAV